MLRTWNLDFHMKKIEIGGVWKRVLRKMFVPKTVEVPSSCRKLHKKELHQIV